MRTRSEIKRWISASWLRVWLCAAVFTFTVCSLYSLNYLTGEQRASAARCARAAFVARQPAPCVEALRASLHLPDAAVWADNLFVFTYSLVFVLSPMRLHQSASRDRLIPVPRWMDWLLGAVVMLAVCGALSDYAENFWLLAHLEPEQPPTVEEFDLMAVFTAWKFRLFFCNAVLAILATLWWRGRAATSDA
jgi:hypothetical protein